MWTNLPLGGTWAIPIPGKKQTQFQEKENGKSGFDRGLRIYSYTFLKIQRKAFIHLWKSAELCNTPWKFLAQVKNPATRSMEILHEFLWVVIPVLLILITGGVEEGRFEDILFWIPPAPCNFSFFLLWLPLENPDTTKLNPWIFHKFVLDPFLEIPRPKTEIPGNSTHMLFLWYPCLPGNSISSTLPLPPIWISPQYPLPWLLGNSISSSSPLPSALFGFFLE